MGVTLEELDRAYQLANVGDCIASGNEKTTNKLFKCLNGTAWWACTEPRKGYEGWSWTDGKKHALSFVGSLIVTPVDPELLWE